MTPIARWRLAALVDRIDGQAAAKIDSLDPVVALALGQIVSAARRDPDWLYDQAHRLVAVGSALVAFVDHGTTPPFDVPAILRDAIEGMPDAPEPDRSAL